MCKHMAALLFAISDAVVAGFYTVCTNLLQTQHQPRKGLVDSALLCDIKTPKAKPNMNSDEKPRCHNFDPHVAMHRKSKNLSDFDLDGLASISEGKAVVLIYAGKHCSLELTSEPSRCHECFNTNNFSCLIYSGGISKFEE